MNTPSRDVFLSHRSANKELVRRLAADIESESWQGRKFLAWLAEAEIPFDAGIGTAGVERQTSADGYELRFAVNYLAGFLLTRLLLPLLKQSTPARIVNVSSAGQQAIDFSDVMLTCGYSGQGAYCQSKLAQILFTIDLAEELKGAGITANCLHPATFMNTTMVRKTGVPTENQIRTYW
jgi:NAD(P)-dependent dehydrogenase (short-subunit alcohol dehydrogenase family)